MTRNVGIYMATTGGMSKVTAALGLIGNVFLYNGPESARERAKRDHGRPRRPREGLPSRHGGPGSAKVQEGSFKSSFGRSREGEGRAGSAKSSFRWIIFWQDVPKCGRLCSKISSAELADFVELVSVNGTMAGAPNPLVTLQGPR